MVAVDPFWLALSYLLGIALAVDQLRRPRAAWEAAHRDRRLWIALTTLLSFHGLGSYAVIVYVLGVLPRFRAGWRPRESRPLDPVRSALARHRPRPRAPRVSSHGEEDATARDLVVVAAVLLFAASLIHSAVIADHFAHYWLEGVFFAVVTCLQTVWAVLVYRDPLNVRVLVAGVAGNLTLIVLWAISRTTGLPVGPQPWEPEAVGVADVLTTLDELAAIGLVAMALARLRRRRGPAHAHQRRLAGMVAGPLVIYSLLAALGGDLAHH